MNLLLVDDEEYVIESIKKNVKWSNTGIKEIYTSSTMQQAQDIMKMLPIDVIVSDIVMQEGSGFDFMTWVRQEQYEVQVIFLTSYAEFDYAKRAISLDSVDYLLKPIDFLKLTKALQLAVNKANQAKQLEAYKDESFHWKQNRSLLLESFWNELLNGKLVAENLLDEVQKRHLKYNGDERFLVAYLQLYDRNLKKEWDEKIIYFVLGNVLREMLVEYNIQLEAMALIKKQSYAIICKFIDVSNIDRKSNGVFDALAKWITKILKLDIWCGVGDWGDLNTVQESLTYIKRMRENSLSVWNRILYVTDYKLPEFAYQNPYQSVWEEMLRREQKQKLIDSMKIYLKELERNEMITRDILNKFRLDVLQMIYSWLDKQEIKAHLLFSTKESEKYYQNSLEGVMGAEQFAGYLIARAIEYKKYVNKTESVTEQLKQYIDKNYQQEIRRDELAELVYLNTDYMSRIFKKEAGVSISNYLLSKRVEEAKKLLSQSELPINSVSIYVGYSNFSYFTKMFRENTGYSPLEYRRRYKIKTGAKE
jgi:two-component system, response regulator YesN